MLTYMKHANNTMSALALILAVLAVLFAVSVTNTPCAHAASGSCSVGDDENFSGNITFDSGTSFSYTLDHAITTARTIVLPDAQVLTGSLLTGTTTNTLGVVLVGADAAVLVADSSAAGGVAWATPVPTTGASFVDKTADQTVNNSTTLVSDLHLTFSVAANKNYAVWGVLLVDSGGTPDIKVQWLLPASGVADGAVQNTTGTSPLSQFRESTAAVLQGQGAGTPVGLFFTGSIVNAGTPGIAVIQWAQNIAEVSDTKLLEGSWLAFRELN